MKFCSAALHCAAVFCAAGCELRVRRSVPLKAYRKRAKFNRGGAAKFRNSVLRLAPHRAAVSLNFKTMCGGRLAQNLEMKFKRQKFENKADRF